MSTVLITGGAGSLGREFVRLLSPDYDVTVVDNSEWAVAELRFEFPDVTVLLGDYDRAFGYYDYHICCAAYKHVNLGEENVGAFIDNNLTKLQRYLQLNQPGERLLYISTDKAVEPISSYGATKMLAEALVKEAGGVISRSGNFLKSSGSVIPVWEKCIAEGKPVPITDERMVRYVCDMDVAVKEIWEQYLAGADLVIPTVRKIRVMDLLTEVLKKHGYMSPEAYEPGVTVIGMRPGEKLEEKLKWDHE